MALTKTIENGKAFLSRRLKAFDILVVLARFFYMFVAGVTRTHTVSVLNVLRDSKFTRTNAIFHNE